MAPRDSSTGSRIKPNLELVQKIDDYAADLLETSDDDNLEERQASLAVVTKWIAVRHKLVDVESLDGAGLSNYRASITGAGSEREGDTLAKLTTSTLGRPVGRPPKRPEPTADLGRDIDAIAARLPDAAAGDVRRGSKDSGDKDDFTSKRAGQLRAGLSRNGESD